MKCFLLPKGWVKILFHLIVQYSFHLLMESILYNPKRDYIFWGSNVLQSLSNTNNLIKLVLYQKYSCISALSGQGTHITRNVLCSFHLYKQIFSWLKITCDLISKNTNNDSAHPFQHCTAFTLLQTVWCKHMPNYCESDLMKSLHILLGNLELSYETCQPDTDLRSLILKDSMFAVVYFLVNILCAIKIKASLKSDR